MATYEDFLSTMDAVRSGLMKYINLGEGYELEAIKELQGILNNLDNVESMFKEQVDAETYARRKYLKEYSERLKLEKEEMNVVGEES